VEGNSRVSNVAVHLETQTSRATTRGTYQATPTRKLTHKADIMAKVGSEEAGHRQPRSDSASNGVFWLGWRGPIGLVFTAYGVFGRF